MAPLMEKQNVTEAELNALRNKFQLLEGDRKAYYEMSMHTMKENKNALASLRDENKELRKKLATIQREARSAAASQCLISCESRNVFFF